jgi:YVTN family beta-propeller protein
MAARNLIQQRLLIAATLTLAFSLVSRTAGAQGAPCSPSSKSPVRVPVAGTLGDVIIDDRCEFVYFTNTTSNRVEVFSLQTGTLQTPIQVGSQPAGLDITPDGAYLYVANSGGNNVSVVDLTQRVELRKIPVPAGFSNDRPYSIAIANNGLALFSTTFAGSGFGARMMQLTLATDAVAQRADFWFSGTTTERTRLSASGDRSTIGIVAGDISSGAVFKFTASTNSFSAEKDLNAFVSAVSLDWTGSKLLVTPGAYVLDATLTLSGTIPLTSGWGGSAVDPGGAIGYRAASPLIDVLNLSTFLKTGGLPLGDTVDQAALYNEVGQMDISVDGKLLGVITDHGLSLVRTDAPVDTVPPALSVPADFTVPRTSAAGAIVSFVVSASDDVDPNPPVSCTPFSGSLFPIGTTPVTCTATDASGNRATAAFLVHVIVPGRNRGPGDFNGDGRVDMTVFRPSSGTWFTRYSDSSLTFNVQWGTNTDVPVPGDYDGDGKTDIAVYRPSSGQWFILKSGMNFTSWDTVLWGLDSDIPVAGDYDGDGRTDVAVYRPSNDMWYLLLSSTNYTGGTGYAWGAPGDTPVPADYDGDGRTDIVVYRPSTGHWFVRKSTTNFATWDTYQWGIPGDIPVPGDYDGDGKAEIAIYRPSSGTWYFLLSSTGYLGGAAYAWGLTGDVPVPGDFDGDGHTDIAIYRPSSGYWFILMSSTSYTAWATYQWGTVGDVAILGRP